VCNCFEKSFREALTEKESTVLWLFVEKELAKPKRPYEELIEEVGLTPEEFENDYKQVFDKTMVVGREKCGSSPFH
jgi:hypothetical protein